MNGQQNSPNQSQALIASQPKIIKNSTELQNPADEKEQQQANPNLQIKQIQNNPEGGVRSVRKSYLKKKILVDLQKVRLGVRLAKIFETSSQQQQLNIGGAKIQQSYQQQNENFKKMIPKLDLMSLENSAHFFDENTFKYFHALNLGEGRVFGDLGILTKKPRAATIVCNEDCYFGVLNVEDYSKILMDQKKKKMQKGIKFLASTINISLSIEKMAKISQFFEKRLFASGERIYEEGDQVQYIYIIKRGEVELFRKLQTCYGINQNQTITVSIGIIGTKSYFGEDDTLFNRKRKYTAIAKIDTKLLMCKKKDFQKLMNEISEMNIALKEMALKKEFWRDQKYLEIQKTRQSIKKIDALHKNKNIHNAIQSQLQENQDRLQKQLNEALSTLYSQPTQQTQHTQEHDKFECMQSEEIVRKQIIKLEKDSQTINLAISRNRENYLTNNRSLVKSNSNQQTPFLEKAKSQPQNNQSYQINQPKSQTRQQSPQSSPRQIPIDSKNQSPKNSPLSSPKRYINLSKQNSLQSPKQSPNNRHNQFNQPKNVDQIQSFSNCYQDYIENESEQTKEDQIDYANCTITKDDFIGSGINSQKCYFKGNYKNISPRIKQIIQQNPDLNKEGQLKELLCKIQQKKVILQNNSMGQQQFSVMHNLKESSDMFGDITHKQDKLKDLRKSLESAETLKRNSINERLLIKQGKITRQEQLEQLLKKYKEKNTTKSDMSQSLTGEFFIQSQQPQAREQLFDLKRRSSLNQLLNSDILKKKDIIIQSDLLNNSENFNSIMQSSTYSQTSAKSSKKSDYDNFIFFSQKNANKCLNSVQQKSSFFYNPQHRKIGSLNLQPAKQQSFLIKNQQINNLSNHNKSGNIDQDQLRTSQQAKINLSRQSFSQTQNSGFLKNITEFINPLPSPQQTPFKNSKIYAQFQNLKNNMEKIVIVNHMGKPTTYIQQPFQSNLK